MITEIVTHGSPAHQDEVVAYIMLRDHGEEKLPGVSTAIFRCLTEKDNLEKLAARDDVVLLGVGSTFRTAANAHRIFDEHAVDGNGPKKDVCAATLTAQFLGLDQVFSWGQILKYVLHTDKNVPSLTLDPAATVMRLQHQGWSLAAVTRYVDIAIRAKLAEAQQFADISMEAIQEEELTLNGEKHLLAVIEEKEERSQTPSFARMFGAAVVIVKNKNGQVQVLTNNSLRLDMRDVVRILRLREQWSKGDKPDMPWKGLEQEGALTEYPTWFFHKEANNILNGGRSRPDIPPTKLVLEQIVEIAKLGLEKDRFEPRRQEKCQGGMCTSTPRNSCPWYNLGLVRCRALRVPAHQNSR